MEAVTFIPIMISALVAKNISIQRTCVSIAAILEHVKESWRSAVNTKPEHFSLWQRWIPSFLYFCALSRYCFKHLGRAPFCQVTKGTVGDKRIYSSSLGAAG